MTQDDPKPEEKKEEKKEEKPAEKKPEPAVEKIKKATDIFDGDSE